MTDEQFDKIVSLLFGTENEMLLGIRLLANSNKKEFDKRFTEYINSFVTQIYDTVQVSYKEISIIPNQSFYLQKETENCYNVYSTEYINDSLCDSYICNQWLKSHVIRDITQFIILCYTYKFYNCLIKNI